MITPNKRPGFNSRLNNPEGEHIIPETIHPRLASGIVPNVHEHFGSFPYSLKKGRREDAREKIEYRINHHKNWIASEFSRDTEELLHLIDERLLVFDPNIASVKIDISGLTDEESILFESHLRLQCAERLEHKIRMNIESPKVNWDYLTSEPDEHQAKYLTFQETQGLMVDYAVVGKIEETKLPYYKSIISEYPNITFHDLLEKMLSFKKGVDNVFQEEIRKNLEQAQAQGRLTSIRLTPTFNSVGRDTRRGLITGLSGSGKTEAKKTALTALGGLKAHNDKIIHHDNLVKHAGRWHVSRALTTRSPRLEESPATLEGDKGIKKDDFINQLKRGLLVYAWPDPHDVLYGTEGPQFQFDFLNPHIFDSKPIYPRHLLSPTESLVVWLEVSDNEQRISRAEERSNEPMPVHRKEMKPVPPQAAVVITNNGKTEDTVKQFREDVLEFIRIVVEARRASLLANLPR